MHVPEIKDYGCDDTTYQTIYIDGDLHYSDGLAIPV